MTKDKQLSSIMKHIKEEIESNDSFLITTHIFPDPDALGSELALYAFLLKLGKSPRIVNSGPPPEKLKFMDKYGWIEIFDPSHLNAEYLQNDAVIVLDCSLLERIGHLAEVCRRFNGLKICMDHHIFEGGFAEMEPHPRFHRDGTFYSGFHPSPWGGIPVPESPSIPGQARGLLGTGLNLIDTGRSAMGEILYDLFGLFTVKIDRDIAEWLYLSIMADTRSFQFDVTTPATHRVIADLLEFGIKPEKMFEKVYESNDLREAKLFGRALSSLVRVEDGKLLWFKITRQMCEEAGTWPIHTDYFISFVRSFQGSDIVILFREDLDGSTKVSLRSKHSIDVNRIARELGGGGHCCASGIDMDCGLDEAIEKVLAAARKFL